MNVLGASRSTVWSVKVGPLMTVSRQGLTSVIEVVMLSLHSAGPLVVITMSVTVTDSIPLTSDTSEVTTVN